MAISKTLATGTIIRTHNYGDIDNNDRYVGQTISVKLENGEYSSIIHVESVDCGSGTFANNIEINKSLLTELGFSIIEI